MKQIPKDPIILISYINTQLRDNYSSLEELCQTLDINQHELVEKLLDVGYRYEPTIKRFR